MNDSSQRATDPTQKQYASWQFSLRALLLWTPVVGIFFAWLPPFAAIAALYFIGLALLIYVIASPWKMAHAFLMIHFATVLLLYACYLSDPRSSSHLVVSGFWTALVIKDMPLGYIIPVAMGFPTGPMIFYVALSVGSVLWWVLGFVLGTIRMFIARAIA